MATPNHPPNGDAQNGTFEKDLEREGANLGGQVPNNDEDQGEYGNLVRYISNYKDGRRASTISGGDDDVKKRPFWKFWGKGGSGPSGDGFETPDDWLETDMKKGLTSTEVETRRKKTGWNELTTEKNNLFLAFLGYFTGPILYGQ